MKTLYGILVCVALFALRADGKLTQFATPGNANDYVDNILATVKNDSSFLESMDPAVVPDFSEGFLTIKNGVIHGLNNLYRSSDATLDYDEDTELIHINTGIAVEHLKFVGEYSYKVLFAAIKGDVEAELDHIDVHLDVRMQTDGKGHLEEFRVVRFSGFHIANISGLSVVLNWFLRLVANLVMKLMKNTIQSKIEKHGAQHINSALQNFSFEM